MLSAAKISRRLHLERGTGRQLSRSQAGRPTGVDVLSVCLDKKVGTQPSADEDQPDAKIRLEGDDGTGSYVRTSFSMRAGCQV